MVLFSTRASLRAATMWIILPVFLFGLMAVVSVQAQETTSQSTPASAEEAAVRGVPEIVVDAWARGDGQGVSMAFTEDVDFIAGDGRMVQGREALVPYFQEQFDTWLAGSRVVADVVNVRFLRDDLAVVHTVGGIMFPGETEVQPDWAGIQTWVVVNEGGEWLAAAYQNSRISPEVQGLAATPAAEE
jgi:uncharacterized protein (TIGR02246 family)